MRLVFQLYERGQFQRGKKLLITLLNRLPDTKLIAGIHQRLRKTSNSKPNSVQSLIKTSGVFEVRSIYHPVKIDKDSFKSNWTSAKPENSKAVFHSGTKKLPKKFSGIMARKTWHTMTETEFSRSSCAWQWLRNYVCQNLKADDVSVKETHHAYCFFNVLQLSFIIQSGC